MPDNAIARATEPAAPFMEKPTEVAPGLYCLPAWMPVPGVGMLPVNAFLLMGREPILVDTGLGALRDDFMKMLGGLIDIDSIRWIWLSHTDADHIGNLEAVCAAAPRAAVVTSFLGQGKLAMMDRLPGKVHLVENGGVLETTDRALKAVRPPYYDAPETLGFLDADGRALFCGDAFGAVMEKPVAWTEQLDQTALGEGLSTWASIDAPWLALCRERTFAAALGAMAEARPAVLLSGHLPPATGESLPRLAAMAGETQAVLASAG